MDAISATPNVSSSSTNAKSVKFIETDISTEKTDILKRKTTGNPNWVTTAGGAGPVNLTLNFLANTQNDVEVLIVRSVTVNFNFVSKYATDVQQYSCRISSRFGSTSRTVYSEGVYPLTITYTPPQYLPASVAKSGTVFACSVTPAKFASATFEISVASIDFSRYIIALEST